MLYFLVLLVSLSTVVSASDGSGEQNKKSEVKRLYDCPKCIAKYFKLGCLHTHLTEKHNVSDQILIVKMLSEALSSQGDRQQNNDQEVKQEFFQCSICSAKFAFKETLGKHLKVHGAEKEYKYSYCNASFDTKGNLTRHEQEHLIPLNAVMPSQSLSQVYWQQSFLPELILTDDELKSLENNGNGFLSVSDVYKLFGLNNHGFAQEEIMVSSCSLCKRTFENQKMLYDHIEKKHALPYFDNEKELAEIFDFDAD